MTVTIQIHDVPDQLIAMVEQMLRLPVQNMEFSFNQAGGQISEILGMCSSHHEDNLNAKIERLAKDN